MRKARQVPTAVINKAAWVIAGKAGASLGVLAIYWLLAVDLSAGEFGIVVLLHSLVTVAIAFGQCGTRQMVLRDVARVSVDSDGIAIRDVATANIVLCLLGCVLAGVIVGGVTSASMTSRLGAGGFIAIVIWAAGFGVSGVIGEAYRGLGRLREAALFGSVAPAAGSCVVVVVSLLLTRLKVASVDNAADAVFLLGLGYGIGSIVGVVAFRRQIGFAGLGKITMMFDRGRPRTLASFSVYGAFTIALSQADLWAVGLLGGAALAGAYGFATKFVALVALPLFVFNGVAANRIVQLEALGAKERLERMLRGGAALSVLAAAGTLLCVAIAFPMMAALYENKLLLEAGLPVLVILGVGQLVNAFTGSCGVVLLYVRGQAAMLKIIFLTVGSAVMALAILGEGLGTTSVASIFFCAMLAQNVLMLIAVKRATGLRTQASFRGLLSNPSAVFADLNTVGRR